MMPLASWDLAFGSLSLASDGDGIEKEAVQRGVLSSFPNYEQLWKLHVAPATMRPNTIQLRPSASKAVSALAMLSHSIFGDLFSAATTLGKVRAGDLGEAYRNPLDAMSSDGNALQKFKGIQDTIEDLGTELGRHLVLWSKPAWDTVWGPRRQKWILYRNNLTHYSRPFVAEKAGAHYVIHPDYLLENMTWQEQEALMRSSPGTFAQFADVCDLVHKESIAWLNDAYRDVISILAPLRTDPRYQRLWGWDLSKPGAAAWQQPAISMPPIPQGHQGLNAPSPASLGTTQSWDISGKATIP